MLSSNMGYHSEYIHYSKVDGNTKYGGCLYCFPRKAIAGGAYNENALSGSRSMQSNICTAHTSDVYSARKIYIEATIKSDGLGNYITNGGNHPDYIHHTDVDGSNKYGSAYGFPRRATIGACYYEPGTVCGSRSFSSDYSTARTANAYSAHLFI